MDAYGFGQRDNLQARCLLNEEKRKMNVNQSKSFDYLRYWKRRRWVVIIN
jgi:ribosomal protein S9